MFPYPVARSWLTYKERVADLQRVEEECRKRDADASNRASDLRRIARDEGISLETARIRKSEVLDASDAADAERKAVRDFRARFGPPENGVGAPFASGRWLALSPSAPTPPADDLLARFP